jgi:hypothetical protein
MSKIPFTGLFEKTKYKSASLWPMGAVMVGGVGNPTLHRRRTKAKTAMVDGIDMSLIGLDDLSDAIDSMPCES